MNVHVELIIGFGLSFELVYGDPEDPDDPPWAAHLILGPIGVILLPQA
jgi:hypothetical protein